jgi:hypothetical protein
MVILTIAVIIFQINFKILKTKNVYRYKIELIN